jgi:elongator complex protein 3
MALKKIAEELANEISSGKISSVRELNSRKLFFCKKFGLKNIPSNPSLFFHIPNAPLRTQSFFSIKPSRAFSGVQNIAIMVKPHPCPGECIYCPSGIGKKTPKSYTGGEPSAMRGLMFGYSAFKQTKNRIEQLDLIGHRAEKIELIIMGGTFPSMSLYYQKNFVKRALDAITEKNNSSFSAAKKAAENSPRRIVGLTIESRPDWCGKKEINHFLDFGATRVELGVQNPDDKIYSLIKRGHSVKAVSDSTKLLKDSAFKVCFHLMPGLPGSSFSKDISNFKKVFSDPSFKPDMVKIYPCLVMPNTKLYDLWKKGEFNPLSSKDAIQLVSKVKEIVPPWVRIMRVQRDIPANLIACGVKKSNLRELVLNEMQKNEKFCNCIRCREAGVQKSLGKKFDLNKFKLSVQEYDASDGTEFFISYESPKKDILAGFCRLRIPANPFRKEITDSSALLRELHVYGEALELGARKNEAVQHKGIGKMLLNEAERIAKDELEKKELIVISGLGVKEYYKKQGYRTKGCYVAKKLI